MTTQTITLTAPNGDTYTATRGNDSEPWEIAYPEGGDRFYGDVREVKARMKAIMATLGADTQNEPAKIATEKIATEKIGPAMRAIRKEKNMMLADIEAATGIYKGYLSKIEMGMHAVTDTELDAIAAALGTTSAHLIAGGQP